MRAVFATSLFAAVALAQTTTTKSGSATSTISSASFSNPETAFTTQTNSLGVITGHPDPDTSVGTPNTSVGDPGQADTSIPALPSGDTSVVSVPAGFPTGIQTVTIGNATVTASINNSTTVLLTAGRTGSATGAATTGSGSSGSSGSGTTGSGSGSSTTSSSGTSSTSSGSAGQVQVAGGALVGLAGFFAAML